MAKMQRFAIAGVAALTLAAPVFATTALGQDAPDIRSAQTEGLRGPDGPMTAGRSVWKGNSNSISPGDSVLIERMGDPSEIKETPRLL